MDPMVCGGGSTTPLSSLDFRGVFTMPIGLSRLSWHLPPGSVDLLPMLWFCSTVAIFRGGEFGGKTVSSRRPSGLLATGL